MVTAILLVLGFQAAASPYVSTTHRGSKAYTYSGGSITNAVANNDFKDNGQFTSTRYVRVNQPTPKTLLNKNGPSTTTWTASGTLVTSIMACESRGGITPMSCGNWKNYTP